MRKNLICIVIEILLLSLLHCDNPQQTAQTEKNKNGAMDTSRSKKITLTVTDGETVGGSIVPASTNESNIDSVIAAELVLLKNRYENNGYTNIQPIPNCEQCSDLEFILVLERMLETHALGINRLTDRNYFLYNDIIQDSIIGATYLTMKDDPVTKRTLKDVEAQYSERFNIPTPWWWICSIEERIRRLEIAIKTKKRYPYYPVEYYRMGKTMAAYEMWFKHQLPECTNASCLEHKRLEHAEQALDAGLPLFSQKEDATLKKKLKTAYKKMFNGVCLKKCVNRRQGVKSHLL